METSSGNPAPELGSLRELAAYAAVFDAPDFTAGEWTSPVRRPDGVIELGWFKYSPSALEFVQAAYENGWVVQFDWMTWAVTPRGKRLIHDPVSIASATQEELLQVLTTAIRGDRFSEGELAGAFERGTVGAIARRAGELAASEHT